MQWLCATGTALGTATCFMLTRKVHAASPGGGRSIQQLSVYENPEAEVEFVPEQPSAMQDMVRSVRKPVTDRVSVFWNTFNAHGKTFVVQPICEKVDKLAGQEDYVKMPAIAVLSGASGLIIAKRLRGRGIVSRVVRVAGYTMALTMLYAAPFYPDKVGDVMSSTKAIAKETLGETLGRLGAQSDKSKPGNES